MIYNNVVRLEIFVEYKELQDYYFFLKISENNLQFIKFIYWYIIIIREKKRKNMYGILVINV